MDTEEKITNKPEFEYIKNWACGNAPLGIAVDNYEYVYITDQTLDLIYKYSKEGDLVNQWGATCDPVSITTDDENKIYVVETNIRLTKFDTDGNVLNSWGGIQGGDDIAVDHNGYIYLVDNNNIYKYDSNGTLINNIPTIFLTTPKISVDNNNCIYKTGESMAFNDVLMKFTKDGEFISQMDSYPASMEDIDISRFGYIYFLALNNGIMGVIDVYSMDKKFIIRSDDFNIGLPDDFALDKEAKYVYIIERGVNLVHKIKINWCEDQLIER